jgi:dolichyl-diphosphooligosaccharide--protein glycosyltransferase
MARDRRFWLTALAVAGVFVFALFVRTTWNIEAATPDGTFVLSESDAYYEHHTAVNIQKTWTHPIEDPLVNYPVGGINPNPPLWEWWQALWGSILQPVFAGDAANHPTACPTGPEQQLCVSTWWVTEFSPALFGALTVVLVVLLGRELWNWRAGLLGGFLLATSTGHIERSVLGFADHDAFILFFLTLSFLFLVKALNVGREGRWIEHWGSVGSVREGLARYVRANHLSLAYALLAGVGLAGAGLSWKGYAYGAGIFFLYGTLQVLVNHWRRRDSTHILVPITLALAAGTLLTLPYYLHPGLGAVFDTVLPLVFITLAWVAFGVVFSATRDLPFVLVIPAAILIAIVAIAAAFVLVPSVAVSLLAPLVYFKQTKLYTTIAEAHPADFNTMVFGAGVVGFFFALAALVWLIYINRKTWRPSWLFAAVWGVVAMFMTWSAVRFLINATPAFALLGGWGTSLVIDRLRFDLIGKNLAGLGGLSRDALKRAVNAWHVVGAVLLALLLLFPNVLLAVDAGMPSQFEDKLVQDELRAAGKPDTDAARRETFVAQRFGAFGQGFISDYWRNLFEWLSTQDTQLPPEQRPAFLSWWDYGHWALSLGMHPAVADNFQNGFRFAGTFIVAQNETQAVQLFIARIADRVEAGEIDKGVITGALGRAGVQDAEGAYQLLRQYRFAPQVDLGQATAALQAIEAASGDRIRYFAVDVRLFPFDNPQTRGIDFGSIFYAPVVLSDHDPDDYVQAMIKMDLGERNPDGTPKREYTQAEFDAIQRDVRKLPVLQQANPFPVYKYKEAFFNSSFYRAYIGTPVGLGRLPATECQASQATFPVEGDSLPGLPMPGFCMEHFRLVYLSGSVRMIKYYPGAVVEGTVSVDGRPLDGTGEACGAGAEGAPRCRVVVYDDAGQSIFDQNVGQLTDTFKASFRAQHGRDLQPSDFDVPHSVAGLDAQGRYRLLAPFSTTGQITVRAFRDAAELGNRTLAVSGEQAEQGFAFPAGTGDIASQSGGVQGTVFFDRDRNRQLGEGEGGLAGATLTFDGAQTVAAGQDGTFNVTGLAPGQHQVLAALASYDMEQTPEQSQFTVSPGETAAFHVPMLLRKAAVNGTVWRDADADGQLGPDEGVQRVRVSAQPDFRVAGNTAFREPAAFSGANGTLGLQLTPGTYVLRGEASDGSVLGTALQVAPGQGALQLAVNATMLVQGTAVTVNLTVMKDGNVTAANGASVLFQPTQGGLPAQEGAPANGTLSLKLAPGTYEVLAQFTLEGQAYELSPPLTLVVGADPVSIDARLAPKG